MADLEREESAEQRRTQSGQGLKILTSNQILSRLQISLAQLKSGNNSERLKNKIRKLFYILCIDKKNWLKQPIVIWSILFKNGNNLYKHWK